MHRNYSVSDFGCRQERYNRKRMHLLFEENLLII